MKKENFYKNVNRYFSDGLAKEIIATEYFSVLNMGNQCYIICPFKFFKNESIQFGFQISKEDVRKIVENPKFGNFWLTSLNKENIKKLLFDISVSNYERVKNFLMQYDVYTPSQRIDVELENELLNKKNKNNNKFSL